MSHRRPILPSLALACALLMARPSPAAAQSADDVASRVGTVARAMGAVARQLWMLDTTLAADLNRGNSETANLRSSIVYVRDSGVWRFASYLSGALETTDGAVENDRTGLNLAIARRFGDRWRLVALEEIVRAPLDGLRVRNLAGGMAVWTPQVSERAQTSLYFGAGWAHERFTTDEPDQDYGAGLAGGSSTITLSPTSTLNFIGSYTQDLGEAGNFTLGSSIELKAQVNAVMGLTLSYAADYDHVPAAGKVSTNHALSAGLTLKWRSAK